MKKKPDTMVTMLLIFALGLAVTSFSSMSVGSDSQQRAVSTSLERY